MLIEGVYISANYRSLVITLLMMLLMMNITLLYNDNVLIHLLNKLMY